MVLALSRGLTRHADVAVAYLKGAGTLAPAFRDAGIPVHALGIERALHAAGLWHLVRLLASGRFDVVHTHLLHAGILGRAAARLARVPVIIHTQHNTLYWETGSPLLALANRATLRLAHRVIAVGDTVARMAALHGRVPRGRIVTILNGVDVNRFRSADARGFLADAFGVPPDAPLVGVVAGFRPEGA
jgi:glycosyltransferase involved in cell wall biosynthesis